MSETKCAYCGDEKVLENVPYDSYKGKFFCGNKVKPCYLNWRIIETRAETSKDIKFNIDRIIYMWRRYEGRNHKDTKGKFYNFGDLDELERRIKDFFKNPEKFDWDKGIVVFGELDDD